MTEWTGKCATVVERTCSGVCEHCGHMMVYKQSEDVAIVNTHCIVCAANGILTVIYLTRDKYDGGN